MRFNDTLKIDLDNLTSSRRTQGSSVRVSKLAFQDNAQQPLARTYHASCLVRNFMVVIGGEANSDLKDFWALDLDFNVWRKPEV